MKQRLPVHRGGCLVPEHKLNQCAILNQGQTKMQQTVGCRRCHRGRAKGTPGAGGVCISKAQSNLRLGHGEGLKCKMGGSSRLASVVFEKPSAFKAALTREWGSHKAQPGRETAHVPEVQLDKMTFTLISTFEIIFQGRKYQMGWKSGKNTQILELSTLLFVLIAISS